MLYIDDRINRDALLTMLKALKEHNTRLYRFALCKDEKILVQLSPEPYSYTDKQLVFSISKSVTSTAVGYCYDRGLLKPEDKIISFFPDELTHNADPHIKALTLHDLLTMHLRTPDPIDDMRKADDPVREILRAPV